MHEIDILKNLDHPNILRLYEFYEDPKRFYLVTELCTGGELFDEITDKKLFSELDSSKLVSQILGALSYCHSKNIVHRDIKPENVLLDSKNNQTIKLIDFGSSEILEKGKILREIIGTAYYIAPDILN